MEVLTDWIIPILLYSGPLFSYGLVVKRYPTIGRKKFYWRSIAVHITAFVPFLISLAMGNPDSLHALIFPAVTGFILFVSGLIYLVYVFGTTKRNAT
jgi:hypothetical protein